MPWPATSKSGSRRHEHGTMIYESLLTRPVKHHSSSNITTQHAIIITTASQLYRCKRIHTSTSSQAHQDPWLSQLSRLRRTLRLLRAIKSFIHGPSGQSCCWAGLPSHACLQCDQGSLRVHPGSLQSQVSGQVSSVFLNRLLTHSRPTVHWRSLGCAHSRSRDCLALCRPA